MTRPMADHTRSMGDETAPSSGSTAGTETEPGAGTPRLPAPLQVRDPSRYVVLAEHGRGGIGRVVRATDREFGRDVALKELLRRTAMSESRFLREAVITSRLEHPNIVPVHEAGRWPDGTPFYTMKLVSGEPLQVRIDAARTWADRLALLPRVVAVCDAIAYAHDRGVIHRDLKPSNIIVGAYGETIVIDWGLAKYVTDEDSLGDDDSAAMSPDLTAAGTVLGTPAYMAPEQAAGQRADLRSDVYALGAIVRDVIAGRKHAAPPAGAAAAEVDVPRDLASIVARAMHKDADDRYPTAKELGDDLKRFLAGERVLAHAYTRRERASRWFSAHRRLVQGSALLLVLLLGVTVFFLAQEARLRGEAQSARLASDSERVRADRQSLALLEEQARAELNAGHPFRAAPLLAEAYRRDPDRLVVRWMLTDALRAVDALALSFDAAPPTVPGQPLDRSTFTLCLSPDDRELLTGQMTGVGFWDAATGAPRRRWEIEGHGVRACYGSDGTVHVIDFMNTASLRDPATGRELYTLQATDDSSVAALSPDGRQAVRQVADDKMEVWSTSPPALVRTYPLHHDSFVPLALSADGTKLATWDGAATVLSSPATGAVVARLPSPGEVVREISFRRDGAQLLAIMKDRSVRIWDLATGLPRARLREHVGDPTVAVFSGDGALIATADSDAVFIWDASSGVRLAAFDAQRRAGTAAAAFSHAGRRLATTTSDARVQVWDLAPERWARPLPGHAGIVYGRYLGSGDRVFTVQADGTGRIWSTATGALERSFEMKVETRGLSLAVSPDGSRIAFPVLNGPPRIVDAATGQVLFELATGQEQVRGMAFDPSGQRIATASQQGWLRQWSAADGHPLEPPIREPRGRSFNSVAFSPDGARLITAGRGPIRIWDAATGKLLRELGPSGASTAAFSPDGTRVLTGSWEEYVAQIWSAATGALEVTLEGHRDKVMWASWSRDGHLVATSSHDHMAKLWDAATGTLLRTIEGPIHTAELSPDGTHILTTGPAFAVIWDVELDRRTPAEVAAVVAARSPWRLVDGRLTLAP